MKDNRNIYGKQSKRRLNRPFDSLYDTYYKQVYRFVYRLTGDSFEAEDITQETFIRLNDYLKTVPTVPDYITAWLYRVAANLCRNLVKRKSKYQKIIKEIGNNQPAVNDVETDYIRLEKENNIRTTLNQLPYRDRLLLMLYRDGLSYEEMAAVIKVKKTSVGKLLSRAIERCARKIKEGEKNELLKKERNNSIHR